MAPPALVVSRVTRSLFDTTGFRRVGVVSRRGAKAQPVVLELPHRDGVVAHRAREHRARARDVVRRIGAEGREARELVQHDRLLAILLGAAHRLGRDEGGGDLAGHELQRVDRGLIEPDLRRFILIWRAFLPLKKNMFEMAQVVLGTMPRAWYRARETGKTWYPSLKDLVDERVADRAEAGEEIEEPAEEVET